MIWYQAMSVSGCSNLFFCGLSKDRIALIVTCDECIGTLYDHHHRDIFHRENHSNILRA